MRVLASVRLCPQLFAPKKMKIHITGIVWIMAKGTRAVSAAACPVVP